MDHPNNLRVVRNKLKLTQAEVSAHWASIRLSTAALSKAVAGSARISIAY